MWTNLDLCRESERQEVLETEKGPNLSGFLGQWLSRLLVTVCPGFDFAQYMCNAIEQAAEHDREAIMHYPQSRYMYVLFDYVPGLYAFAFFRVRTLRYWFSRRGSSKSEDH
jgi:hypothetical protein